MMLTVVPMTETATVAMCLKASAPAAGRSGATHPAGGSHTYTLRLDGVVGDHSMQASGLVIVRQEPGGACAEPASRPEPRAAGASVATRLNAGEHTCTLWV